MTPPKVGIVTINYKNPQDTLETLDSLKNLRYDNFKIFLVDNESSGETKKVLEQKRKEIAFDLLTSAKNLGFAGGNNLGIKEALKQNCQYILLLNNDVTVKPNFLSRLVAVAQQDDQVGILGPRINYFAEKSRIWFNGGLVNWLYTKGTHRDLDKKEKDVPEDKEPRASSYITGCAMLVRAKLFFELGFLNEDFFMYHEDLDFCLRAGERGHKIIFVPQAKIYHKISRTTQPGSSTYIYYHVRNGLFNGWWHGGYLRKTILLIFSFLRLFKQIPKFIIPGQRKWGQGVWRGTFDFYSRKKGKTRDF